MAKFVEPVWNEPTTFTWDDENRNTKVELPTGAVVTNTHRFVKLLYELQDSHGTKKFVRDGQNYLLETDGGGTTKVVYTVEPDEFGNVISQWRID